MPASSSRLALVLLSVTFSSHSDRFSVERFLDRDERGGRDTEVARGGREATAPRDGEERVERVGGVKATVKLCYANTERTSCGGCYVHPTAITSSKGTQTSATP